MWDARWMANDHAVREAVRPGRGTKWLVRLTRRYLDEGARVLEGGCGLGHNVAALCRAGYRVEGVDFAPATLVALHRVAPELALVLSDVRELPFADCSFDGYWSLGVIEHFYSGYEPLAREMARVIRPQGFLFITFPYMSPLRRLRAKLGRYQPLPVAGEPQDFYQFALDVSDVVRELARFDFELRYQASMSGLQGFREETALLGKGLKRLENYQGGSVAWRGARFAMEYLSLLGAGHTCIMVLQKSVNSK
jgi:SAM-dependent methyltransferase